VAAALAEQIARLDQAGEISFKEEMNLRVSGSKQYSRWRLQELVAAVGASGVALIDATFPGKAGGSSPPSGRQRCAPLVRGPLLAFHTEGAGRPGGASDSVTTDVGVSCFLV
jgi:hypothetical protein